MEEAIAHLGNCTYMALTLLEAAKLAPSVQTATVIEEYASTSEILRVLPFTNIQGNAYSYNREDKLPGIGFRGINEAYDESVGVLNPQTEVLKIAGGDLDVDRFIIDTMGMQVRSTHEMMKVKALSHAWTRNFIKGDSRTNPRIFDGLQVRLTGTQLISNANAGEALSLNKLDELIDAVDNPTHLIMNKTMRRRLTQAGRNTSVGGYISSTVDEFGRGMEMYANLPILVVEYDNDGNEILPFSETSQDASDSACTSIYCVSLGEMMLAGIQGAVNGTYGISTRDIGELETKPVMRTRVDWYSAIALSHGRAAARLYGINNAAVTV